MDIKKVRKLIELLENSQVDELEVHEGEESIRVSRYAKNAVTLNPSSTSTFSPNTQLTETPLSSQTTDADGNMAKQASQELQGQIIKSPMVGTFYSAASPDSNPFVSVGQKINVGDVLCIVEAMKMMNQIKSEKSGTITSILPEDGQPVEYDQPLFTIS